MHALEVVCAVVLALRCYSATQETHLIYTHGESLYRITMEGTHQQMLVRSAGRAAIFDYHQKDELLFWTDGKGGTIHSMFMNGTQYKIIRLVNAIISGLAVNWKENQLYWSNWRTGTIEQLDLIGGRSRPVMWNISQPRHLSIDVMNRALLCASAGATPRIHFLSLEKTGAHHTWPVGCRVSGITADPPKKRFFWACSIRRGSAGFLGSRHYEGWGLRVIPLQKGSKPAGITVAADSVIYADSSTNAIHRVAWPSGRIVASLNLGTSSSSLGGIRVVPPVQWNDQTAIKDGVQLSRAKNVPLLLFANGLDIRRVRFDGSGYRNVTAQAPYGHVSGITFDPLEGMVSALQQTHNAFAFIVQIVNFCSSKSKLFFLFVIHHFPVLYFRVSASIFVPNM
uniref:pro-epidermal growth factor-like n=1 Tax=Myxine glutinosa TaxID=7769 RepID=UPI00358E4A5E